MALSQLIEKEKPSVRDHFLDEYLHPNLKDPKSERSLNYKNISIIETEERYKFYKIVEESKYYQDVPGNNCHMIDADFSDWIIFKPEFNFPKLGLGKEEGFETNSCEEGKLLKLFVV